MRRVPVTCVKAGAKALTPAGPAGSMDGNERKDGQFDQLYQE
jgi:hypothetical protein